MKCVACGTTEEIHKYSVWKLNDGTERCNYICNPCNTERCKKYRHTPRGKVASLKASRTYNAKNPIRQKIWVEAQPIIKEPCVMCGENRADKHHPDVSRPLYVVFLCRLHHKMAHKLNKKHDLVLQ